MEQRVYSLTRLVKLTDCKSDKGKQRQRDKVLVIPFHASQNGYDPKVYK